MRKLLLSLTVIAGAAVAAAGAQATPHRPAMGVAPQVLAVQYHGDRRQHEWRQHERWRRHHEWRRWHHQRGW